MFAALILFTVFHFGQSRFCELVVYKDSNRGGSSWVLFDVHLCWQTDSNFENDVVSSAWVKSHNAFSCTATFYDGCGCGFGGPSETLTVNPYSENTINFGAVNNKVSCITLSVATPQPTRPTTMPTQTTLIPTIQTAVPSINPTVYPTMDPTNEPTQEPTNEPTSHPTAEPTLHPTYEPTNEPITGKPTLDGIRKYEIDYGVEITITFDYNTTNMSDIDLKLKMIITEIIDDQIMMNDMINCVATNDYNISIVNTGNSLSIKAVIFVCNDNAQNKLYVTFDEHLETDFIDKLTIIAIEPNGLHVDIDKIGGYITTAITTEIVSTYLVKVKEDDHDEENMDVVILVIIITVLLSIIIALSLVVIKMQSNKAKDIDKAVRDALEMNKSESTGRFTCNSYSERGEGDNTFTVENEENNDNDNNEKKDNILRVERDQRVMSQNTFIVGSADGDDTHNIDVNETDSEDIDEMYGIEDVEEEKQEHITPQYRTDNEDTGGDDDMYNSPINDDVITTKEETTMGTM